MIFICNSLILNTFLFLLNIQYIQSIIKYFIYIHINYIIYYFLFFNFHFKDYFLYNEFIFTI